MGEAAIDHAIASGRLFPLFRAAFGVGHAEVGPKGLMLAAVHACGTGAVVSHGSAAFILGLWESEPGPIAAYVSQERVLRGAQGSGDPSAPCAAASW